MSTRNYKSTLIPGVLILSAQLAIASSGSGIDLTINSACPPGVDLCQNKEPPRPVSKAPGWPTQAATERVEPQAAPRPEAPEAQAPLPITAQDAAGLLTAITSKVFQNGPRFQVTLIDGSLVRIDPATRTLLLGKETLSQIEQLGLPINEAINSLMARAIAQYLFETSSRVADQEPREISEEKETQELTRRILIELEITPSAAERVYEQLPKSLDGRL